MTNSCVVRGIEFTRTGDDGSRPLLLDLTCRNRLCRTRI